jgi:hypothetical protein
MLLDIGGLTRVAGVTTTSVKCLRTYTNVHVMLNSLVPSALCAATHVVAELFSLGVGTPSAVVTLSELLVGGVITSSIPARCVQHRGSGHAHYRHDEVHHLFLGCALAGYALSFLTEAGACVAMRPVRSCRTCGLR